MVGPHRTEGRKPRRRQSYVAMVEGVEHGVPFRTFYKRLDAAERDAMAVHGAVVTDLFTLRRRKFINGKWEDA